MKVLLALIPLSLLAVALSPANAKPLSDLQARQAAEHIDSLVSTDLKKAKLTPNGLIDDATFLRRAYLGIIGRIQSELADAETPAQRKKLQAAYQAARNEQNRARMQREPLSMMKNSPDPRARSGTLRAAD